MTSGSAVTSSHREEYSVSAFGRTTSVNDASGNTGRCAKTFTGARIPCGCSVLVVTRRVTSISTSGYA